MNVQEASLSGVLRTVLIILAIYFLVRLLGRLAMPFMNGRGNARKSGSSQQGPDNRKEGDVTIEYTDKDKARRQKDSGEGDYVDFEELN